MSIEKIDVLLKKLSETHDPDGANPKLSSRSELALKAWAEKQPVRMRKHGDGWSIPDAANLVDRSAAWRLSDYLVSSVHGGSIWFSPRKTAKTEDDTAGAHDALSADPDYKSVTPREQNFLQNFLGSATGHNSNDRMNFHNDVKSYGYKNVAKLTKLFAKHYPAFSASSQKSEASARRNSCR